ncbi:DNA replication factor Cdt1 [Pholidichthys leucotaenia]
MSQAQLTNFYSHRKKNFQGPTKPSKPGADVVAPGITSFISDHKDPLSCSPSVHEEFIRVIDEAAGLSDGQSADKESLSSPRTPKRSSADAEFDLGAAVFATSANHSTSKKRRQEARGGGDDPGKVTTKTARKKLVLPGETAKVLAKEDIAALQSRLQMAKKRAEKITSASSPSTPSSSSVSSTPPPSCDAGAPGCIVARAKELAAKAQRRREEREAAKGQQAEAEAEDSCEKPAYQRYHTLAQDAPPGLSLPYHYKVLAEMFRSMETVTAMMFNRSETATFAKVKQGVQDMMHKRFEESHVGQIKTVFPEAYTFRQEKNIPTFNSSVKKGSYQLTVEPRFQSEQREDRPVLTASRLLERRRIFHQNLVSIVKRHHKDFLSSLNPPMSVPEDKLTCWHPRFNVDMVPAVQISSLPLVPNTEKLTTAQEVLDKARSLITPKMEKALVSLVQKTGDDHAEKNEPSPQNTAAPQPSAPPPAPTAKVPSSLKGVSQSLLDRIRAKEAQKLQAAMTRNSAQEERLLMMSRLGELARILRNVFVAEKKPALTMEVACNRMVTSYRSALSTGEMEKHIRLLAEVAADWLTIHPIRKDFYVKLNKSMELSVVVDKLNRKLKEEERL